MTTETEAGVSELRLKQLIAIAEHRRIDGSDWKEEMALALRELLAARATLASMRANEWAAVSERLPDGGDDWRDDTRILAFAGPPLPEWHDVDEDGYIEGIQTLTVYFLKNGEFTQNITHWKSLPPPPERAL